MRKGFSLVEMLVVTGIIAVLVGASIGGYSKMTRAAERAKAQELVSNVATALTMIYQTEGSWPKRLTATGASDGLLDKDVALALKSYFSMTVIDGKLAGTDRFGIVSPWAQNVLKRADSGLGSRVTGDSTVQDHILHFAIDIDGDGIIQGANVGGQSVNIRAAAAVWCAGRDGVMAQYATGGGNRSDDVYSWTPGQTREAQ